MLGWQAECDGRPDSRGPGGQGPGDQDTRLTTRPDDRQGGPRTRDIGRNQVDTRVWRCIGSEWIPRLVRLIKADRNRLTEFDALLTTVQK